MAQNIPLWWHEPAHPGVIQQLSDVVSVYRAIREKVQPQIDKAFDEASRQIGFVVATTLPVAVTVDDKGKVTAVTIGGQFKGTLFERELAKAFTPLIGQNVAGVSPGTYQLYAIWQAALSLVLQHYWLEPAQPGTVLVPYFTEARVSQFLGFRSQMNHLPSISGGSRSSDSGY